jgi:hypothetical protein
VISITVIGANFVPVGSGQRCLGNTIQTKSTSLEDCAGKCMRYPQCVGTQYTSTEGDNDTRKCLRYPECVGMENTFTEGDNDTACELMTSLDCKETSPSNDTNLFAKCNTVESFLIFLFYFEMYLTKTVALHVLKDNLFWRIKDLHIHHNL